MNNFFNYFFGIVSLIGTIGTIYFERRARKLAMEKNRFSWAEVHQACQKLSQTAIKKWQPDVVITFNGTPGLVSQLITAEAENQCIKTFFCPLIPKKKKHNANLDSYSEYNSIETARYSILVPKSISTNISQKILIITDAVTSGTSTQAIKNFLGRNTNLQIKVCSLICSNVAVRSNAEPDFYIYYVENDNYFMPWKRF